MSRKPLVSARSLAGWGDESSAARAYDAFGMAPLRMEILRFALSRREISTADVMHEFGLTRNGALQHLKQLAGELLITSRRCTHPRGSGPVTYWSADRDEFDSLVESLLRHVHSGPG